MRSFAKYSLSFFILVGLLAVTSCQKEDLRLEENPAAQQEEMTLALERLVLELNFRVPTDGLTDEQILEKYNERMSILPEKDQTFLINAIEGQMARATASGSTSAPLDFRTSQTLLTAGIPGDEFGWGVEAANNRVYIGSSGEQKVYEYSDFRGATLLGEISPSVDADDFGRNVSISGDWMAVSAPQFENGNGKVFMFKKVGDAWVEQGILTPPDGEVFFGSSGLALKGNTLAVTSSATGFPSPGSTISVFTRSGDDWLLSGAIFRPGYDWFGIDMDDTGNRIVGTGSVNNNLGIVRASIFSKDRGGWTLEQEVIVPSPIPFAIALPRFVAIQNNTVVLTAIIPGDKHWVITKNGGSWEVTQELLLPPGGAPFTNRFVEIQGGRILIGAASGTNSISDAIYAFDLTGATYELTETFSPSDGGSDAIMWDIAINGNTIVAGLPGTGFPPPSAPGKAYVFK